jgi:hypothetical protein
VDLNHTTAKKPVLKFYNNIWGMGARNRVGIGLSYRPARLHRLAELIPWNQFLSSLKVKKFGLWYSSLYLFYVLEYYIVIY